MPRNGAARVAREVDPRARAKKKKKKKAEASESLSRSPRPRRQRARTGIGRVGRPSARSVLESRGYAPAPSSVGPHSRSASRSSSGNSSSSASSPDRSSRQPAARTRARARRRRRARRRPPRRCRRCARRRARRARARRARRCARAPPPATHVEARVAATGRRDVGATRARRELVEARLAHEPARQQNVRYSRRGSPPAARVSLGRRRRASAREEGVRRRGLEPHAVLEPARARPREPSDRVAPVLERPEATARDDERARRKPAGRGARGARARERQRERRDAGGDHARSTRAPSTKRHGARPRPCRR